MSYIDTNEVIIQVLELLDFIASKYDVKGCDGFTCPIHQRLARAVNWVPKRETIIGEQPCDSTPKN